MARVGLVMLLLAGLASCDQNDASRKAIVAQCTSDGMPEQVCNCLGDKSVARLEPALLDIVVLGIEDRQAEADQKMSELDAPLRNKFTVEVPAIATDCGYNSAVPAT